MARHAALSAALLLAALGATCAIRHPRSAPNELLEGLGLPSLAVHSVVDLSNTCAPAACSCAQGALCVRPVACRRSPRPLGRCHGLSRTQNLRGRGHAPRAHSAPLRACKPLAGLTRVTAQAG